MMNKKRKTNMAITLIVIILFLIISFMVPIRKQYEIIYENPSDEGGPLGECYYNIYGVKIKTIY